MEFTLEMKMTKEQSERRPVPESSQEIATIATAVRRPAFRVRMESHLTPRGVRLLCDQGGADLDSVKLAVMALVAVPRPYNRHTWAVLGDMGDTGIDPVSEHHEAGEFCADHYLDRLVCVGMRASEIARGAKDQGMNDDQVEMFADAPTAMNYLRENVSAGDVVLVKGSKAMNPEGMIAAMFSV